jgi:hypothetical protein
LVLLRTGGDGEATRDLLGIQPGEYLIKAVCVGYTTFADNVRLRERDGVMTLLIALDPE